MASHYEQQRISKLNKIVYQLELHELILKIILALTGVTAVFLVAVMLEVAK